MIIVDETTSKSLSNATILLTEKETTQMIGYLEELLSNKKQNEHYHLNNDNFSKEITIALYDKTKNVDIFSEKYKTLILTED